MVNFQRKERYDWEDLLTIMRILRAPGGCPWDREQTHQSIRRNFLEETYEALDAIDRDSAPDMQDLTQIGSSQCLHDTAYIIFPSSSTCILG